MEERQDLDIHRCLGTMADRLEEQRVRVCLVRDQFAKQLEHSLSWWLQSCSLPGGLGLGHQ